MHFEDFSEDPSCLLAVQISLAVWRKLRIPCDSKGAGSVWTWGLLLCIAVGRPVTCFPTLWFGCGPGSVVLHHRESFHYLLPVFDKSFLDLGITVPASDDYY